MASQHQSAHVPHHAAVLPLGKACRRRHAEVRGLSVAAALPAVTELAYQHWESCGHRVALEDLLEVAVRALGQAIEAYRYGPVPFDLFLSQPVSAALRSYLAASVRAG